MASTLKLAADIDLRGVERKLEDLERGLGREVDDLRHKAATLVASRARQFVPQTHYPTRRGGLAASIRAGEGATSHGGYGQGVVSTVPQGPVHEFGGTIAPRGVPIQIKRSAMATKAGESEQERVEQLLRREIQNLLDRLF